MTLSSRADADRGPDAVAVEELNQRRTVGAGRYVQGKSTEESRARGCAGRSQSDRVRRPRNRQVEAGACARAPGGKAFGLGTSFV